MKKERMSVLILLALIGLSACSLNNTRLVQVWTNPAVTAQPIKFEKILVVAVAPSDAERRTAEDALVAQVGPKATPSYSILDWGMIKDVAATKARVHEAGFDGAVVVKWLGFREEKEVIAAPTFSPMWNDYSTSWSSMEEKQVNSWRILQLDIRIFSVKDEQLIWSGKTESTEPPSIPNLIRDVAVVVRKELVKKGLVQKPPKTNDGTR